MPCIDPRSDWSEEEHRKSNIAAYEAALTDMAKVFYYHRCFKTSNEYFTHIMFGSIMTNLLCEAMKVIYKHDLQWECSNQLIDWKVKHDLQDSEREKLSNKIN